MDYTTEELEAQLSEMAGMPPSFEVLIDEPYFSLVHSNGEYLADVKVDRTLTADSQLAAMLEVLGRARSFGLVCTAERPHESGWVSLQFTKIEDVIDYSI